MQLLYELVVLVVMHRQPQVQIQLLAQLQLPPLVEVRETEETMTEQMVALVVVVHLLVLILMVGMVLQIKEVVVVLV